MTRAAGVVVSVGILAALLIIFLMEAQPLPIAGDFTEPFRSMLWELRALDLIGQMMLILAGAFGVLVLTKERIERG